MIQRLNMEYDQLTKAGFKVERVNGKSDEINIVLDGPANSYYAGGHFTLNVKFPAKFPMEKPELRITTKIYHPGVNIEDNGTICLHNTLSKWSPSFFLLKHVIPEILNDFFVNVKDSTIFQPELKDQLDNDAAAFQAEAKKWVQQYAQ